MCGNKDASGPLRGKQRDYELSHIVLWTKGETKKNLRVLFRPSKGFVLRPPRISTTASPTTYAVWRVMFQHLLANFHLLNNLGRLHFFKVHLWDDFAQLEVLDNVLGSIKLSPCQSMLVLHKFVPYVP